MIFEKLKYRFELAPEYSELKPWVCELNSTFSTSGISIFKSRNEVKIFSVGNYQLNVKSFKIPNLINRVAYVYFRGSKAERSFRYARKFLLLGVNTPSAIGFLDVVERGLLKQSYYVSLHFNADFTLREVLNYKVDNREEIIRQWVNFTYANLHQNNIFHLDYSPGNTLISSIDGNYVFQVVDLNRMSFGPIDFIKGLSNFRQLDTDLPTLEFIAAQYATICDEDIKTATKLLLGFDQKNKASRKFRGDMKQVLRSFLGLKSDSED